MDHSQERKSYVHIKRPKALSPGRGVDEEVGADFANEDEDVVDEALVDELFGDSDGEDVSNIDLPIEYELRRAKRPNLQASSPASGSLRGALCCPSGAASSANVSIRDVFEAEISYIVYVRIFDLILSYMYFRILKNIVYFSYIFVYEYL